MENTVKMGWLPLLILCNTIKESGNAKTTYNPVRNGMGIRH